MLISLVVAVSVLLCVISLLFSLILLTMVQDSTLDVVVVYVGVGDQQSQQQQQKLRATLLVTAPEINCSISVPLLVDSRRR